MSMRIECQELHKYLNDYLSLFHSEQVIESSKTTKLLFDCFCQK
jgi:hypothetical protein